MRDFIRKMVIMLVAVSMLLILDNCIRNRIRSKSPDDEQSIEYTKSITIPSNDGQNKFSSQKSDSNSETCTEEVGPEPSALLRISKSDQVQLLKLAFAEAGNQDVDGKALVMLVVLNRVKSDEFPDTIHEVIHAKRQFSPVSNGAFDSATASDPGCLEALELVMQGYDISQGATYFESMKSRDSWHYQNLNFLFEHGGHWFYN